MGIVLVIALALAHHKVFGLKARSRELLDQLELDQAERGGPLLDDDVIFDDEDVIVDEG